MIEEHAQVVAVQGDAAWVETQRGSACGSCAAHAGCGSAALGKLIGRRPTSVRVLNTAGALPGEEVVIGIDESALVRGSVLVYLVPLLALLGGAILGEAWWRPYAGGGEWPVIVAAVAGLALGLAWVRGRAPQLGQDARYQPTILRRVAASGSDRITFAVGPR